MAALKSTAPILLPLLKQYFGFTSFRPLQEEIIRDALAGKDVFALLPTGGGKSLCFQLPAMVQSGLTVVVSPLIALMKDQVDAMQAGGIPATFLNSSLAHGESRARLRGLHNGEYRLLYVAPERLMLSGCFRICSVGTCVCWPWTRRIASANGDTISARNTASSRSCGSFFPKHR